MIAPTASGTATPEGPSPLPVVLLVGLLAVAATAGGLLLRRRGNGRSTVLERPDAPMEPARAGAAIEAELHEIISEARARELLAPAGADRDAEPGEFVGTR